MNEQRASRWLSWTGPVYTVLFFVAVLALEASTPGEKASAREVVDYYSGHQGRITLAALLAPVLSALLVLFACHLRTVVRARTGAAGTAPTVLVCGAVLWASGILLGSVFDLALVSSAHHGQDQIAQTVNVLSNDGWIPFIAGIAVTMLGAGMTVLGSDVLPRWMGWLALVVGLDSLLGPGGFTGFFLAPLWLLVAGVLLARSSSTTAPVAAGA